VGPAKRALNVAKPVISSGQRPDHIRCAIYTRKSTEEGLEQEFNSLDAQREACAAYVLSQRHEGWTLLPGSYDDGGYSGGSMERPGLKQLLADVAAGKVDVIVVYKVDRLTRSLADFSKIVEVLEKAKASFVSVTQAFNTTTSMGRLMLNVLLSFAQFEREVTGERIRDKVAASKRKGMWMGGQVPLGYDLGTRKLIINDAEANTIRLIYDRYTALGSIGALAADLDQRGIRSKLRADKHGRVYGGVAFTAGPLAHLLKNPIYIGEVQHKGERFAGEHDAIIDRSVWDAVQALLESNRNCHRTGASAESPSLLAGMITDAEGRPMSPSHATKGTRRYRYYFTQVGIDRKMPADGWRIPAVDIERAVIDKLQSWLGQSAELLDALGHVEDPATLVTAAASLSASVAAMPTFKLRELLLELDADVTIRADAIVLRLDRTRMLGKLGATQAEDGTEGISLLLPASLVRRGRELRLALAPTTSSAPSLVDPTLINLIVKAEKAHATLVAQGKEIERLRRNELARYARLRTLAPDIVSAIVEGRQPASLSARNLLRTACMPMEWSEQRIALGFA
jgi:site-specific DNA recombinase